MSPTSASPDWIVVDEASEVDSSVYTTATLTLDAMRNLYNAATDGMFHDYYTWTGVSGDVHPIIDPLDEIMPDGIKWGEAGEKLPARFQSQRIEPNIHIEYPKPVYPSLRRWVVNKFLTVRFV